MLLSHNIIEDFFMKNTMNRRYFLKTCSAATLGIAFTRSAFSAYEKDKNDPRVPEELILNYHLMHPGEEGSTADPNAAFFLDGIYHLHYILRHPWQGKWSFAFVHVTSPDMLHWTWQTTKLQPAFTGHGMFSGTGFITKEGKPAIIYHGQSSGRNQIVIAKNNQLSAWEKPYPVAVRKADGSEQEMVHWDPDCFLIGDTYYGISGGKNPPVFKSKDLKNWTYIGDFMKHDLPDVALGEDISCPNFFRLNNKWMLLCISHPLGCRYYLGDWDAKTEQFLPQTHGRMTWPVNDKNLNDFFAPESILTPDGRRVMWAWCMSQNEQLKSRMIQSLPREISLDNNGRLRINPLRELESLRYTMVSFSGIILTPEPQKYDGNTSKRITTLDGDAFEIRIIIDRKQAERKHFGFRLFTDAVHTGMSLMIRPEFRTLRLNRTDAPFAVADLPSGEDVELRIFIDKYLVEVFVNNRQAIIADYMDYRSASGFDAYTFGEPTVIKNIEIWRLKPANQGFLNAMKNRIWLPLAENSDSL